MPTQDWSNLLETLRSQGREAASERLIALGAAPFQPALEGLLALEGVGDPERALPALESLADPVGALLTVDDMAREGVLADLDAAEVAVTMRLGSQSRHFGRMAARRPEIRARLTAPGGLGEPESAEMLLAGASEAMAEGGLASLRRWRMAALTRAFFREAHSLAPLEETLGEVSALASACLEVVLKHARETVIKETGDAVDAEGQPIPMVIVGLGKLGGWELNFSSDVDIVCVYATDEGRLERQRGEAEWSVHRFFVKVARMVAAEMEAATSEGRLWRVDLRLRPGGARGPMVHAVGAVESYYEAWGRTFERCVWLKARPVAGDKALGWLLIERLRPFVYRRSLDLSAFDELREMKDKIDRHAASSIPAYQRRGGAGKGPALGGWDLKTGKGGIREVEFVLQALQLIYGGRQPEIRTPSTMAAFESLGAAGLISARDVGVLSAAYVFLRLCEHRVQMEGERQTHALPARQADFDRLAHRMGFEPESFESTLKDHKAKVEQIFDQMFRTEDKGSPRWPEAVMAVLDWPEYDMGDAALTAALSAMGFAHPKQAVGHLAVLRGRPSTPFAPSASVSMRALAPLLLSEVLSSADPDLAMVHMTRFLIQIGPRTSIYRSLGSAPAALRLLVSFFGSSRYLSQIFLRRPHMVDALLLRGGWGSLAALASGDERWASRGRLEADLAAVLDGIEGEEARLGALRRFKHRCELRAALVDLSGLVGPREVGAMLSDLADVCLTQVLDEAWAGLILRHGEPRDAAGETSGFAVLALGKLGSGELTFGSDLDLVFVHGAGGQTCGVKPIDNRTFFARLARKVIAFVSTQLADGRLFHIDTRLRPNGSRGTLVVSLAAFEKYHAGSSALWERQALLRGRSVCDRGGLGARLSQSLAGAIWGRGEAAPEVLGALDAMRSRMEAEVASEGATVYNIKVGFGGIVDVEFAVQACQLIWGAQRPALKTPSTFEALDALVDAGLLGEGRGVALRSAYTYLRQLESRLRMLSGTDASRIEVGDPDALRRLALRAGYRGQAPGEDLRRELTRVRQQVRALYVQVVREGWPFGLSGSDG